MLGYVILERKVSTADSHCQVAVLYGDSHSMKSNQVQVILDMSYGYRYFELLDLRGDRFLYFVIFTLLNSEHDWWILEKFIA